MTEKQLMTNDEIWQIESEHTSYEEKIKNVHHLLAVMGSEFEDIRKVYLMARGGDSTKEDYMTQCMDQFDGLLTIAMDTTKINGTTTIK